MAKISRTVFWCRACLVFGLFAVVFCGFIAADAHAQQTNPQKRQGVKFTPTALDISDIALVESYLTRLTNFTAKFTQRQNNSVITGVFYFLRQPGDASKMRFDYDKPSNISLVTAHGMLIYIDRYNDEASYIPLDNSLIGLFVEEKIKFGDKITVTGVVRRGDQLEMALRQTDNEDFGEAVLQFRRNGNALSLAGWRVTDGDGTRTDVTLTFMVAGLPDTPNLFTYIPPQMRGGHPRGRQ